MSQEQEVLVNKDMSTEVGPTVAVDAKSAGKSQIVWFAVIGSVATAASLFGYDVPQDLQDNAKHLVETGLEAVSLFSMVYIGVRRAFFSKTITKAASGTK